MLELILFYLALSLSYSIVAYAFSNILITNGNLLERPFEWIAKKTRVKKFIETKVPEELIGIAESKKEPYFKENIIIRLIRCSVCLSGQIALWYSIINQLNIKDIIIITCTTLIITKILQRILN